MIRNLKPGLQMSNSNYLQKISIVVNQGVTVSFDLLYTPQVTTAPYKKLIYLMKLYILNILQMGAVSGIHLTILPLTLVEILT
jgi:hypothetical protein